MNKSTLWPYILVIAVTCSITAAGLQRLPDNFHALLFLIAIGTTGLMLLLSWKWHKHHATLAWMYFLSSLLTILLITNSISHLSGL